MERWRHEQRETLRDGERDREALIDGEGDRERH